MVAAWRSHVRQNVVISQTALITPAATFPEYGHPDSHVRQYVIREGNPADGSHILLFR